MNTTEQTEELSGGVVQPPVKVFISIPISGREEEAQRQAKEIKDWLVEHFEDMEIITPFEISNNDLSKPYHWYMGKDIERLLQCDIVIQAEGWKKSKGCQCEAATADVYGIKRIQYSDIYYALLTRHFALYRVTPNGVSYEVGEIKDWRKHFLDTNSTFNMDEAKQIYRKKIEEPSKRIVNALSHNIELIARSAVFIHDASNIFAAEQAGLDYYRKNLPILEVKDENGKTMEKCQFIPMRVKIEN